MHQRDAPHTTACNCETTVANLTNAQQSSQLLVKSSVTRLGDFCKFCWPTFVTKVLQIYGDFLSYFDNIKL